MSRSLIATLVSDIYLPKYIAYFLRDALLTWITNLDSNASAKNYESEEEEGEDRPEFDNDSDQGSGILVKFTNYFKWKWTFVIKSYFSSNIWAFSV